MAVPRGYFGVDPAGGVGQAAEAGGSALLAQAAGLVSGGIGFPLAMAGTSLLSGLVGKWMGERAWKGEREWLEKTGLAAMANPKDIGKGLETGLEYAMARQPTDLARPVERTGRASAMAARSKFASGVSVPVEAKMATRALQAVQRTADVVRTVEKDIRRQREQVVAPAIGARGQLRGAVAMAGGEFARGQSIAARNRALSQGSLYGMAMRGLSQMGAALYHGTQDSDLAKYLATELGQEGIDALTGGVA